MTSAELLDRAIDEIIAGRSPDVVPLGTEEVALAVGAAGLVAAVRAVPPSTGRADIRRRVLTTVLEERPRRRWSRWVVLVPTTLLLLGGGIAVAASKAVPGDSLYSIRRGFAAMRLLVAFGDHAKAVALLDRAQGTLNDATRLAARGRESQAQDALSVFVGDLENARAEIARLETADRGGLETRADTLEARAQIVARLIERRGVDRPGPGVSGDEPREGSGPSGSPGRGHGRPSGEGSPGSGSRGEGKPSAPGEGHGIMGGGERPQDEFVHGSSQSSSGGHREGGEG